jgi:hypothetical protein
VRDAGIEAEVCTVPPQLRRVVRRVLADDLAPDCRAQLLDDPEPEPSDR